MGEIELIAALAHSTLLEIGQQGLALGKGLENAALNIDQTPNNSIQFLFAVAESQIQFAEQCREIYSNTVAVSASTNKPGAT